MIYPKLLHLYRGYSNIWSGYDFYFIKWSVKMYVLRVAKPWMKYTVFHFMKWNKSHSHSKNLNFLFIIYKIYWRREANLTFCCVMFDLQFCPLAVKYKNLIFLYFTCENITFWKYALYFGNIFLYFINLYRKKKWK